MISLLIRLVMGKSSGSFWTGLVMLLTGIGLTVGSYMLAASFGGVTFVFYGLIIVGIVRMILAAPTLGTGGHSGYRGSRPYMTGAPSYQTGAPVMLPYGASLAEVNPGHCWLCGGKVKRGAKICLHCGASMGSPQQDSEIAQAAGYSASSSSLVVPSMRPQAPPPSTWSYQPTAPAPRGPYSPPESGYGPYSSPQPGYGQYSPPEPGYGPYSSPDPAYGQYSAPTQRRGSRAAPRQPRQPRQPRRDQKEAPEMPLRIFEPPVRPRRPPREEPYADDSRDWGPPPPRRGPGW